MKNYYQILGVEQDADFVAIKKRYRKLSKKYHPDISDEENAEKKFKEITKAYEVLGSEESRVKYDQKIARKFRQKKKAKSSRNTKRRKTAKSNFSKGDFEDFDQKFKNFFGFDPKTKEKVEQQEVKDDSMNTSNLFNEYFGVDK